MLNGSEPKNSDANARFYSNFKSLDRVGVTGRLVGQGRVARVARLGSPVAGWPGDGPMSRGGAVQLLSGRVVELLGGRAVWRLGD